ncbi:PhzF family phenazine biosynthesis protein [Paenibacillus sp. SI8]|uniref:PhzF family phenazine biosynthesis protein n=1 Tax=unclassified Paenibacillus TaxID=185978 RepID=UPI0034670526
MTALPLTFSIVDVFAENKYEGNQLAVFRHTAHLTSEEMLAIAREMNFSETTFILSDEPVNGGYDVRIFTPAEEVPFAGHPTLGSAFVIQQEIIGRPVDRITLNLKVGAIPVTFEKEHAGMAWMQQRPPVFGESVDAETVASMLGLPISSIDARFPIQEASTGLPSLIVPLTNLEAVRSCRVNLELYFRLIEKLSAKMILVFCPETYQPGNQLNARVFGEYFGCPEDPATGSANGNLAGYLIKHNYFGSDSIDIRVEQGFEIKRPSILYHRAQQVNDHISIQIGGKTIYTAKGEWV